MKKILFAMYALNNGGAERSLVNLLSEIDSNEYDIDLLLFAKEGMFLSQIPAYVNILEASAVLESLYSVNKEKRQMKTTIYKYISTAISRLLEHDLQAQNAARWVKFYSRIVPQLKGHYDVAVAYISRDIMYYVADKVDADKKIVFIHNDYSAAGHPKKYDMPYFEKMDKLVTISDTCADVLEREFPQHKNKIYNVPNLTSSTIIRNRAAENIPVELRSEKEFKIVSVGRLNEQKGFDWAVQAAKELKLKGLKFHWYIIGNGELKGSLEKQIQELQIENCFTLLGPRENPYIYMKNCDVVAQTSRWEGKSVVLDEAKIIGTPILTTDYPTAKDQILAGKEGIVVEMAPKAIAEGIEQLLLNKELREDIHNYLVSHEYGNAEEIQRYYELFE